jgi:hypothetical protein
VINFISLIFRSPDDFFQQLAFLARVCNLLVVVSQSRELLRTIVALIEKSLSLAKNSTELSQYEDMFLKHTCPVCSDIVIGEKYTTFVCSNGHCMCDQCHPRPGLLEF